MPTTDLILDYSRIEKAIRARHPQLFRVFVRPQSSARSPDLNADRAVRI